VAVKCREGQALINSVKKMTGSGKGLLGLWLYKMGDSTDWTLKESMNRKKQVG